MIPQRPAAERVTGTLHGYVSKIGFLEPRIIVSEHAQEMP